MNKSCSAIAIAAILLFLGCTKSTEGEAHNNTDSGAATKSDDTARPPVPDEAEQPATTNASQSPTSDTSLVQPDSGTTENPGADRFEAGIAAYEANNLPLAFQEFLAASKAGHADSQFNLGLMYEKGIGVALDEKQAVAWYGESAERGNSAAQFNLGVLHEHGRGTKVDFDQANKCYRSASQQGDPLAIGNLGMLYIRGDGVPVNKTAGLALLIVSATMDPSPENHAKRNISTTQGLTAEMIAAAQKLSGELAESQDMLASLDRFLNATSTNKR